MHLFRSEQLTLCPLSSLPLWHRFPLCLCVRFPLCLYSAWHRSHARTHARTHVQSPNNSYAHTGEFEEETKPDEGIWHKVQSLCSVSTTPLSPNPPTIPSLHLCATHPYSHHPHPRALHARMDCSTKTRHHPSSSSTTMATSHCSLLVTCSFAYPFCSPYLSTSTVAGIESV